MTHEFTNTPSDTLLTLIAGFKDREAVGLKKYGTTVDRTDTTLAEWLRHGLHESMDRCVYDQRALDLVISAGLGDLTVASLTSQRAGQPSIEVHDIEEAARAFCAEGCEGDSGTFYPTDDAKWFLTQFVNGLPALYTWSSVAEPIAMRSVDGQISRSALATQPQPGKIPEEKVHKGFGLACTVAWTELHNAMKADGMNPPDSCGPETRKWIEQVVRDSFAVASSQARVDVGHGVPDGWVLRKYRDAPAISVEGPDGAGYVVYATGEATNYDKHIYRLLDALLSPRPDVATPAEITSDTTCSHCGGKCEWFTHRRNNSGVVDGRLKTNDVECVFVLGCTDCCETIKICTADSIVDRMNASPSAWAVVPKEWLSEQVGGEFAEMTAGQGYRRGWNDCRDAMLAAAPECRDAGHRLLASQPAEQPRREPVHGKFVYVVAADAVSDGGWQLYTIHDEPVPMADNWRLIDPDAMTNDALTAAAKAMQVQCDGEDRWQRLSDAVRAQWVDSVRPIADALTSATEVPRD